MNEMFNFACIQILFIVYFMHIDFYNVYAEKFEVQENKMDTLIEELHSMYKDAYENEKTYMTRRLYTKDGNSHYTLHVQKLKEVNGIKTHNLRVEGKTKEDSPIIYINNPVEAGMPNPFLSIYEFKHALRVRAENQKKEFEAKRKNILNSFGVIKKNLNQYKTHNQLNNITNKIFNVKKYTELAIKNSVRKPMRTITHKRNKKLYKRKPKVNNQTKIIIVGSNFTSVQFIVSTPSTRVTKSPHLKITTTLPTMIANEEITTFTKVDEGTAETVVDKELTINSSVDGDLTTKLPPNEMITAGLTADDQITTVKVAKEETITEMVTEKETITEPAATTTTTTTAQPITTTRTRQKKPYVFMGNIDNKNNND